jgi:hypothetical protein
MLCLVVDFILKGVKMGEKNFSHNDQLTFTDEEIEKLHYERFHHPSSTSTEENGSPVSQKPEISSQRNHKTS